MIDMRKSAKQKAFLKKIKKTTDLALKKQAQDGLAKVFTKLGYKAVGREIRAGRNVRGNVKFGIRRIHDKLGPRVKVDTLKFTPQSKKAKNLERNFLTTTNKLLRSGGFRTISPKLLTELRVGDKSFKKKIEERRKQKQSRKRQRR